METAFLFLKNPLFISDLLRTKYLKYLSEKYRVIIFSSAIDAKEARSKYLDSPNVEYVDWKIQNPGIFRIFKFLRTNCLHELDHLTSMRVYYSSEAFLKDKRARLARFLSWPLKPILTLDFFTKLEKLLSTNTGLFKKYVDEYKPALVITATPGIQVFDAEAIILAKKFNIPSLATNFSWDNLTGFKAGRIRKPDYLFVWNQIIKDAAVNIHRFPEEKVFLTGSMRFDRYFDESYKIPPREQFLKSKNLNPQFKTILFATPGSNAPYQLQVINDILDLRKSKQIPDVNLLVRVHPFDSPELYGHLASEDNVWVDAAGKKTERESGVDIDEKSFANLKATLAYSDLNINYKSTISLESFLFDKPVINFMDPTRPAHNKIYSEKDSYYYPVVKHGSVKITNGKKELKEAINLYLNNPFLDSKNRQRVAEIFFAFLDSLSYKRNVDSLEQII